MATTAATIERTPLLDSLSQLRLIGERFEEFVSRQCDELESLRNGLSRRERELNEQQSQLDELRHLNELRVQQYEDQGARLDQLTAELADVWQELNNARQELGSPRRDEQPALRRRIEELERERAALQGDLAQTREEADRLTASAGELDRLRLELTQVRAAAAEAAKIEAERDQALRALAQVRDELQRRPAHAATSAGGDVELEQRLRAAEQERDELASELESILGRSASLAETAARERRQAAQERSEWEGELKTLRRALAAQLQAHTDAAHGQRSPTRGRNGHRGTEKTGSQEAVIDSVMAQFAALKKNNGRTESVAEPAMP